MAQQFDEMGWDPCCSCFSGHFIMEAILKLESVINSTSFQDTVYLFDEELSGYRLTVLVNKQNTFSCKMSCQVIQHHCNWAIRESEFFPPDWRLITQSALP